MSTTTKGRKLDRSKVAAGQEHEVNYEKEKMNTTAGKVKQAIKSAGNSRKAVEKKLK